MPRPRGSKNGLHRGVKTALELKQGDWVHTPHGIGLLHSQNKTYWTVQMGSSGPFRGYHFTVLRPATKEEIAIMEGTSE